MACKGCGRKRKQNLEIAAAQEAKDYLKRVPASNRIKGLDRKWYSVEAPLVTKKPLGHGWTVSVMLDGRGVRVSGRNAPSVVNSVIQLYKDNGIDPEYLTVWYNCNLNWVEKSQVRDRRCGYDDLLSLSEGEVAEETYLPYFWYEKAFGFMGTFLAQENYSYANFMSLVGILKNMLRDNFTGCETCYDLLTDRLLEFERLNTRKEARAWFIEYMNATRIEDGKSTLSENHIANMYKW